jgi:acyl-CoA thioester hydrolase
MQRIRIELPENFSFITEMPVRITDLNYGGHVGNDTILSMIHEARMRFLSHHGLAELNFGGFGIIMSDVGIQFRNELFYGEKVRASVAVGAFSKVAFDLFYKLEKEADGKMVEVALAKTGIVCFDYANRKPVAIPEEVLKKLKVEG